MAKKEKPVKEIKLFLADPNNTDITELKKQEEGVSSPLLKSILGQIKHAEENISRLAFERDPSLNTEYAAIYRQKTTTIPDVILKRMAITDDLVAAIITARSNHVAAFGRPQPDRFSTGFKILPKGEVDKDKKKELDKKIKELTKLILTCGHTKGWDEKERLMTFSTFLSMSVRDGLINGRMATEIITVPDPGSNKRKFHSFRPVDAATIYHATSYKSSAESVRKSARMLLEQMRNKKLDPRLFEEDKYAWIQVIEGTPRQAFTAEELLVWNFYPVTDVNLGGYPITPLDTVVAAVTMHINITTHNKLFFQSGRAARGMVVIKSDDIDEAAVGRIRQHLNASINSSSNSWRTPVFQVGPTDDVRFEILDHQGSRDMEFQYLADSNARTILSAFQMAPDELPGLQHLSKGSNNQALSESNNEYKLEAARDVGIRPLLSQLQDFLNNCLLPVIDPELAKEVEIKLVGLNAESSEKEAARLQQDAPIHGTMDYILNKVEKEPLGKRWGGDFPLNPQYQAILDKYFTVGEIIEHFFGVEGASKDPELQYRRDPFDLQFKQMLQAQKAQAQQQAVAEQEQEQEAPSGRMPPAAGTGEANPQKAIQDQYAIQNDDGSNQGDLSNSVDQLLNTFSKSEKQLPPSKRRIVAQQRHAIKHILDELKKDSEEMLKDITDIAEHHGPKGD